MCQHFLPCPRPGRGKEPKRHNGCFGYYTTSSGFGIWESVAHDEKLWYDINHVPQRTEPALTSRMENGMRVGLSPESEKGKEIAALHRRCLTENRYDRARHGGSWSSMSWTSGSPPTTISPCPAAPASCGILWSIEKNKTQQRPSVFRRGPLMHHAFFRVRNTPVSAAIRAKGARRTKAHSKAWMATPMTAVSGAL